MTGTLEEEGTLSDRASVRLTQAIITGELQQGQKLSESDLASRYGISRGPLREALRQLEGMRLVKRVPHAGAKVVTLSRDMMQDLYGVREALEGLACRMAAINMPDDEVEQLQHLLDQHEKQMATSEGQQYFHSDSDFDFHYQIALGSRNQMIIDLLGDELYHLMRLCRYKTSRLKSRTQPALTQHRHIANAISNRDGELAEILMRRHISGAWTAISELLDEDTTPS